MREPLRFAIVGCGVISPIHALSLAELPSAKLVAVCDIVPERAEALASQYGVEAYLDYEVMFKRADIDVVLVLTPSGLHAQVGIAAAQAGKHVIVEKPVEPVGFIGGTSSKNIWHHSHKRQIMDVIEAISTGRPPRVTGEEGMRALAIVLAVYESARTGQAIRF